MYEFFYIIFIKLYPVICAIISPVNDKARLWVNGRKGVFKNIETSIGDDKSKKVVDALCIAGRV